MVNTTGMRYNEIEVSRPGSSRPYIVLWATRYQAGRGAPTVYQQLLYVENILGIEQSVNAGQVELKLQVEGYPHGVQVAPGNGVLRDDVVGAIERAYRDPLPNANHDEGVI